MLDVAWPEVLVVGAVALVAIGPKDLPKVMHALGTWAAKARRVFLAIQHDIERLGYEAEEQERKRSSEDKTKPPDTE
ncbi:MAG: twin-arginine translocase TatA/TatE family subunit [Bdellovibrionales bacterium]|jgi:sec-independent protein translocase protein TatB